MSYEDLRKTDLFEFFHFSESGRRRLSGDMQEIHLKPGGFQEFIDVMMRIDKSQEVHEGVLYLDRDWIGGPMTVSPFGKDLTKSFIAAVTPPIDRERAENVISTIWNLQGSNDEVIKIEAKTPEGSPVEMLESVYLGIEDKFELFLKESCIKIENVVDVGRKRLRISIESLE